MTKSVAGNPKGLRWRVFPETDMNLQHVSAHGVVRSALLRQNKKQKTKTTKEENKKPMARRAGEHADQRGGRGRRAGGRADRPTDGQRDGRTCGFYYTPEKNTSPNEKSWFFHTDLVF